MSLRDDLGRRARAASACRPPSEPGHPTCLCARLYGHHVHRAVHLSSCPHATKVPASWKRYGG